MQAKKNAFLNQLNELTLRLLNSDIEAEEITAQALRVSKRDSLTYCSEERDDMTDLMLKLEMTMEQFPHANQQFLDPGAVLDYVIEELAGYVATRTDKMKELGNSYEYSEALHESARKQFNGEKFH